MNEYDPFEIVRLIENARRPGDVFAGTPTDPSAQRAARRRHRALLAAVHPDRATILGLSPEVARDAALTLNALYCAWCETVTAASGTGDTTAFVTGAATHVLRERLWVTDQMSAYRTDDPDIRVEIGRIAGVEGVVALPTVAAHLAGHGMRAFAPCVVDTAVTDGHPWVAYRVPAGMVCLDEVHASYPAGLDGRDWAWMVRRIVMTLAAAGRPHGNLGVHSVLIHPDEHGVVLTGWTGPATAGDGSPPARDGNAVARLFGVMLGDRCTRQRAFACAAETLDPETWLHEYDLLLSALYGPRRFRPFTLPRPQPMTA
ncbi:MULTISPECIES: hypothetical protein [unclassified Gordonia (in: high G+C Gram-positive bacteria)]|uniref:hypothetical protein n=1 Tax=unclassified Gordonia (in: high G+C Gram-positive bacteria) TaxID=2657482 RepID=UPI0009AE4255|nr:MULTISPECIES: hypothetical protein [unclassified Gordonia (in: high G+C Gram-positive bacteria)]MDF3285338.1 hypothetical protein [Gordonia sp. N1V]OPX14297.1 hypothetical protein B1964_15815 [Gordonia sp. i37]